jgi:hypothetical protein
MRTRLILMGILIAILLATGAVSLALGASVPHRTAVSLKSSELAAQPFTLEEANASTGGVITLTLGSNGSTGRWQEQADVSDPSVVEQTHNKMLLPVVTGISGEQRSQSWTFRTLREGSSTVRIESEPAQSSTGQESRTFELTLVVVR